VAYTTADELARVAEIRAPSPAQGTALQVAVDAAAFEINQECGTSFGSADPPEVLALVAEVNLERALEHWQQSQVAFGVIDLGGGSVPVMSARDSWDRHAHKLAPVKSSWGIS
jgi:hypothetical protein